MKVFLRFSALAFLVVCLVLLFGLRHRVSAQGNTISLTQTFCGTTTACVWTYHNDNNRDGVNPNEGTLTPTYVKHRSFSHIVVSGLDGLIYAQPLYIHGLYGSAGTVGTCTATQQSPLNVVFVATENNTVYAIDASTGNICWHLSVDRMAPSETAIPWMDQPQNGQNHPSTDLVPESGITSTPVIDLSVTPPIMYVLSAHKISAPVSYDYVLHAIDTTTGGEIVAAQSISSALNTPGNSYFIPIAQKQRPGLAMPPTSNGLATVYAVWGGGDSNRSGNYYGWVTKFQLSYSQVNSGTGGFMYAGNFTSEPPGVGNAYAYQGGIWMGGAAPALDGGGNVYLGVGNGSQNSSYTSGRWDDAVLKLTADSFKTGSSRGAPQDYYMPNDFLQLNGTTNQSVCFLSLCSNGVGDKTIPGDLDMGTGGVVLLSSASPTELVSIGKQGMLYVMQYSTSTSTQTMGGLDGCGYLSCPSWSNPQATDCSTASGPGNIVQCFAAVPFVQGLGGDNGLRGAPTFWPNANYIYMAGIGDAINSPLPLQAFSFNGSTFNTSPYTPDTQHTFNYPGGSTSLTWNSQQGTSTGVIWALDTSAYGKIDWSSCQNPPCYHASGPAVLYAYQAIPDAANNYALDYLWDSSSFTSSMPGAVKFVMPTIADGYIFVAGGEGYPNWYFGSAGQCQAGTTLSCAGQLTILH